MKELGAVIISFGAILPLAWLRAFVIQRLWAWFIVPAFAVAPLKIVTAAGLSLLVALLTFQINGHKWSEDALTNSISGVLCSAGISLLVCLGGRIYLGVFA
jgi:hypothetical protein